MLQWYTAGDKMAAFKWVVMLLAFNLIGLFDMWVTAAPAYGSQESENPDVIDSTSEGINDDVISNIHEEDTHTEVISGDETTKKGDGNVINSEGQEGEHGRESRDTDEHPETSSNPHAEGIGGDETAETGEGIVNNKEGEEDEQGSESGDTDEHPETSSNPHAEGIDGDETAETGEGIVSNKEGEEYEQGSESGDTDEHPETSSNPHAEGIGGDETAESGEGIVTNTEGQEGEHDKESESTDEYSESSSNPHANDDTGNAENVTDEEGDSGPDTPGDVHQDISSEVGTKDQNLSIESSSQRGGSSIEPDTTADNEINVAANATKNLGEAEDGQFGTGGNAVTISVSGSGNKTLLDTRRQKGDIKQTNTDDGINEPGLGTHQRDSESSGSIGSYVVLGVIMAIIVMLLGYSVLKGRGRRAQETKNEDFGTEMIDVKKNLLPRNEFRSEIRPNKLLEEDESKIKLLPDAQHTGDNVQNGEVGIKVHNGMDSQKELGGIDDAPTEKKFDFDKIATQVEPIDAPEDTVNSQNQISTNPFKQAVTAKKQETADGQITHHQPLKTTTHQKAYNNVNGVPETAVEVVPVQTYSGYVTQNNRAQPTYYGLQQQNMGTVNLSGPPVKVMTVVEQGCIPTRPVIVNVERNVLQY